MLFGCAHDELSKMQQMRTWNSPRSALSLWTSSKATARLPCRDVQDVQHSAPGGEADQYTKQIEVRATYGLYSPAETG